MSVDPSRLLLGIEIGGTKLQVGVAAADQAPCVQLERATVDSAQGARGIREQIVRIARPLVARYRPVACGIGFGGPVDSHRGRTVKSHHIDGWDDFDLDAWSRAELGLPAAVGNDADLAGLAEARLGAGRGCQRVFYVTVGTGIGGGFILNGQVYTGGGLAAAELGHLRPGIDATKSDEILESLAAGWGIAAQTRKRMAEVNAAATAGAQVSANRASAIQEAASALLDSVAGDPEKLTTKQIVEAAAAGNPIARHVFDDACRALGWGIAQMITLLAPEIIVIGGGVSLAGEALFFEPVRKYVHTYVFPPLANSYRIAPAELGEEMVIYGAIALAATRLSNRAA